MTDKFIYSIDIVRVKARNSYYDPNNIPSYQYTITSEPKVLYEILLKIGFQGFDEDFIEIGDDQHMGILFWGTENQPEKSLINFLKEIKNLENVISNSDTVYTLEQVVEKKEYERYDILVEDWINSIDPRQNKATGTLREASNTFDTYRYKFRKFIEKIDEMSSQSILNLLIEKYKDNL